jgi:hypothetical protein
MNGPDLLIYHVIYQLMLLILALFIVGLVFLGFINQENVPSSTPPEALAVFGELTKNLSGTAIPEYVLTYGTTHADTTFRWDDANWLFKLQPLWFFWKRAMHSIPAILLFTSPICILR